MCARGGWLLAEEGSAKGGGEWKGREGNTGRWTARKCQFLSLSPATPFLCTVPRTSPQKCTRSEENMLGVILLGLKSLAGRPRHSRFLRYYSQASVLPILAERKNQLTRAPVVTIKKFIRFFKGVFACSAILAHTIIHRSNISASVT